MEKKNPTCIISHKINDCLSLQYFPQKLFEICLNNFKTVLSNENKATFCNKPQVLLQRGQFLISKKKQNNVPFKALFSTEIATMTDALQNFSVSRLTW